MTKKIDYSQSPGLLHKNDKGIWGMYKEYFKNCTAVYWQESSCEEKRILEGFKKNKKRKQQEYINQEFKIYKQSLWDNPMSNYYFKNPSSISFYIRKKNESI